LIEQREILLGPGVSEHVSGVVDAQADQEQDLPGLHALQRLAIADPVVEVLDQIE
jgi:hypothetical protein